MHVTICQLSPLDVLDRCMTQGQLGQVHLALHLVASFLTNLIIFLVARPYLMTASLNRLFSKNFIPTVKEGTSAESSNLGYLSFFLNSSSSGPSSYNSSSPLLS